MYLLQTTAISRSARMRLKIPPATLDSSNVKLEVELGSYSVVCYYEFITVTNHFIQCDNILLPITKLTIIQAENHFLRF